VLLSPFLPLLFMGEEYGETAPFLYFVSHGDPALIEAVRKGRREEFSRFAWQGDIPDPQDRFTFVRSRIDWNSRCTAPHKALREFYKELLRLRREDPVFCRRDKDDLEAISFDSPKALSLRRWDGSRQRLALFNFEGSPATVCITPPAGNWKKILDSSESRWNGAGSSAPGGMESSGELQLTLPASSFALYRLSGEPR
jgi:maltooligosyltrehalose trehalohydrolase